MRRAAVLIASTWLAVAACRGDRAMPATTTTTATPDPRLQAAFADIFRAASAAATKARELHESNLLSASRPLGQ